MAGRRAARAPSRSTKAYAICIPASTAAADPAPSTGANFSNWAGSIPCSRRSTWKTPISATWHGSAAGRCCTSRAAWCITSIAAPSARTSRTAQIQAVLKKNFMLFCWKNIHEWPQLIAHFFFTWCGAAARVVFGDEPGRAEFHRALAGVPAISGRDAVALACAQPGRDRRHRGVPAPAGRLFPRPLRQSSGPPRSGCACCSSRPIHLPAGARRRRVHVPDAARARQAVRRSRDRPARSSGPDSGQRRAAGVLRLGRVPGIQAGRGRYHLQHAAARGDGVCAARPSTG